MTRCRWEVSQGQSGEGGRHEHLGALAAVLMLTAAFTTAEVVGGVLTGSLALLADAGHMLSDVFSLGLALFAVWVARRPPTLQRTFGYRRAEVLAALANGVTLVAIAIWIFVEAYERLQSPPEVLSGWMLVVATVGLVVNVAGLVLLWHGHRENVNVAAAFRHVLADLLGSVGAITAAVIMLVTGWRLADPLISVVIGLLVLGSSWGVLRDSVNILLEATPRGLSAEEIHRAMEAQEGVAEVHDLHIWTITSGFPALTAHVLVRPGENLRARRRDLERLLADRYRIEHTTLQVDHPDEGGRRESNRLTRRGDGRAGPVHPQERGDREGGVGLAWELLEVKIALPAQYSLETHLHAIQERRMTMTLAAEQELQHIGESRGAADHDHDLIHELSKRLDALWRYDQYISNAEGKPAVQALWRELKMEHEQSIKRIKQLIAEEVRSGCF